MQYKTLSKNRYLPLKPITLFLGQFAGEEVWLSACLMYRMLLILKRLRWKRKVIVQVGLDLVLVNDYSLLLDIKSPYDNRSFQICWLFD